MSDSKRSREEEERDDEGDHGEGSECDVNSEDLDQISNLVDVIKEIYAEVDEENVKAVGQAIDENVQAIMVDLGSKLNADLSQDVASVYNLNARFAFYNVCFGKAYEILNKVDPKLAGVFSAIQDANVFVVSRFTDKLLSVHPTMADLIQRLDEAQAKNPDDAEKIDQEIHDLRQQVEKLKDENRNQQDKIARQNREIERLRKEKSSAPSHQTSVTPKNEKYEFQEALDDKRKGASTRSVPRRSYKKAEDAEGPGSAGQGASGGDHGPSILNWIDMNQNIGRTNRRVVTLRQAKDLIEEIAASKQKLDSKCAECPIPRETMEQHMYNYLSQKFGLRNLVVEWATALVNCLKIYWSKDNDCAVFAMILRNECDEEFRGIQKQVKSTIQDLFKIALKTKLPTKKNAEIAKLLDEKFKNWVTQEECTEILRYIYKDEDFQEIKARLDAHVQPTDVKTAGGKEVKRQMALRYREFEKLILDFQLKNHHRFLSRFISLFRSYDQNNFGFIDAPQFRDMVGSIDPENRLDSERLLQQIDPQEMGVIPFSACAAVFASEPMPSDAEGPTTILHYISAESS